MVEPISAGIMAGGSILSGLLGAGASMGSAYSQYKYQRKLQEQSAKLNYNYSKKLTKWQQQNTPTYTRQGLESAGYNPILALGTQIGSAGTSFAGTGQASAPDFSQGLNSALDWANFYKDKKETESRIGVNESQSALNDATKVKTDEEASATAIDNVTRSALNMATIDKIIADTSLAKSQEDLNIMNKEWLPKQFKAQIEQGYINANANYQGALASMQSAKAAIVGANASMFNANTAREEFNLRMPGIEAENKSRQWEADHPYQSRFINQLPGAVSGLVGASILSGPGYMGILNKGNSAVKNFKSSVPYRTNNRYSGY